jgi:segregation and condensation protein A
VSYRVQLPVFSGPMDLLLHLVRQQEVDVHEISIAPILKDYLKHLDVLKQLDLHDIGDFVVMASTLMEIKSRELLPTEAVELEEELDPKDDLIRRLLEYKRYRDLARELDSRADRRSRQTPLVMALPKELQDTDEDDQLDIGKVQVWDLTSAFAKLLDQIGQQATMEIEVDKRDVGYYTRRLLTQFKEKREVGFTEIFDKREGRYGLIGTLIALLEMMKQGYLRAFQEQCFGDIQLAYKGGEEVTADQILAGITAEEEKQRQKEAAAAMAKAAGEGNDIGLEEQAPNEASIETIPEPEQDEAEIAEPIEAEAAESAGEQSG